MRLGDILEIIAAGCLAAAAYIASGLPLALVAIGLYFGYSAQWSDAKLTFKRPQLRRPRRVSMAPEKSMVVFHCAVCGTDSPHDETHQCPDALAA